MCTRGFGNALTPGCSCSIPANPSFNEEQQPIALSTGFLGTVVQAEPASAPRCRSNRDAGLGQRGKPLPRPPLPPLSAVPGPGDGVGLGSEGPCAKENLP